MILRAIADRLHLGAVHTSASWSILRQFGNMSSATLIFVLEQIAADFKRAHGKPESPSASASSSPSTSALPPGCTSFVPMLAFGPGLNVEGCLLKYVGPGSKDERR